MIQEKDFLYRVPVKNALVTAPGQQVRNPEILVDIEGGKFMHGNILDANSTNKLIDQSVKDAIDNSIENGNYVTKDLLEAETSARTKSDEDLNAKIKAEQTRAEGKEKEISDKLAIVDGDSNTEGSFRKAIADVIAAAPEDLDTLKEIADKLAGNDDLHTALNQAITEKADASALANEVTRATGAENDLRTAIGTKADATALSNYVLTTALNQQIDTLNTAISAKQDAGNYITFKQYIEPSNSYEMDKYFVYNYITPGHAHIITSIGKGLKISEEGSGVFTYIDASSISIGYPMLEGNKIDITPYSVVGKIDGNYSFILDERGVQLSGGDNDHVLTSNGSTINMANYLKESDVSGQFAAKADRSDLITLEQKVAANTTAIEGKQDEGNYVTYSSEDSDNYYFHKGFTSSVPFAVDDSDGNEVEYGINGITSSNHSNCLATSDGTFKPISDFASADDVSSLRVGLSKKQDKITVNSVDVTDIETADITKLRTIVRNLIDALSTSGLIKQTSNLE